MQIINILTWTSAKYTLRICFWVKTAPSDISGWSCKHLWWITGNKWRMASFKAPLSWGFLYLKYKIIQNIEIHNLYRKYSFSDKLPKLNNFRQYKKKNSIKLIHFQKKDETITQIIITNIRVNILSMSMHKVYQLFT